ncbi:hypothetical protein CEF21_21105 [Bacillus sp. FJAT-42376]|uniref:hypothetical protein n=1 Tax=Bacillus sp. FJAT-42376 TaxID=2014076 RepID=UPI000F50D888|nr:hypothetical protein [Bacillus sp. FJAT-42376]AZB44582.1 hypothetical protein CEF21_21105 [Bacillus sp. FJAT-42376]
MKELQSMFGQWLEEEGRAVKTIESYDGDLKGFHEFLREKASDSDGPLSRFSFVRFKQYLIELHHNLLFHSFFLILNKNL